MSDVTPRVEFKVFNEHAAAVVSGLRSAGKVGEAAGLDRKLIELVKLRASQINSCAYCTRMHAVDARKAGESEERLDLLAAFHHAPVFNARERAALLWTEALTRMADRPVADAVYNEVRAYFSPAEISALTGLIGVINAWNRICGGLQFAPPDA